MKSHNLACHWRTFLVLAGCFAVLTARAAESRSFSWDSREFQVEDVSAEVQILFRALRFNEATEHWNVDLVLSNAGPRALVHPIFVAVESFANTTGLVSPEGIMAGNRPFIVLTRNNVGAETLAPGTATTRAKAIVLGFVAGGGVPALQLKVFAAPAGPAYALALTRTLNEVGQPLTDVTVFERGPLGDRQLRTDPDYGVVTLGGEPGEYSWRFTREGYRPVWRGLTLLRGAVRLVPNARLVPRLTASQSVPTGVASLVADATDTVELEFRSGSFNETTLVTVQRVGGQTLPGLLPQGWSPVRAFWLDLSNNPNEPVPITVRTAGTLSPGETTALVRWDESVPGWRVWRTPTTTGTDLVESSVPGPGAYALIVADAALLAPPLPQPGELLLPSDPPAQPVPVLSAQGSVDPSSSPASRVPEAVTGTAFVSVTNATGVLPSGLSLRAEVDESYRLQDGTARFAAPYETFLIGYRHDELIGQPPAEATLHLSFPMRPVFHFGAEELAEATVRVEVLTPETFRGEVFDSEGGAIVDGSVRVSAEARDMDGPQAVSLRELTSTNLVNLLAPGQSLAAAFDLTVTGVATNRSLSLQVSNLPPERPFILARVLSDIGFNGLEPVERLQSDTNGTLASLEPALGDRLPGLRRAGQYVLVEVNVPHGLVTGVVRDGTAQPMRGFPVRIGGLPWLALSDAQGRYQLVAPQGEAQVNALDPSTGDTAIVRVTIDDPAVAVPADLDTAPSGPRVVRITPADGATRVPRVTSVVVEFNEAVNPATLLNGIGLLDESNHVVTAALALNLRGTVATLSPATELGANARYRVRLEATIADPSGLTLEGPAEFSFTTVPLSARVSTAQLVIYEPGATNIPSAISDDIPAFTPGDDPSAIVVHGQPGVADPEVPVILVNESTGGTQTVLSKLDGSFSSFISGTEEDFISATFINLNNTRVYVPVSRQEFDNGFVGLYPSGGILEAESDGGLVKVIIQPGSVPAHSKFKLDPISAADLQTMIRGTPPQNGVIVGTGFVLEVTGDELKEGADVSMPVDPADLNLAPGVSRPEDAAFALAAVVEVDGEIAYHMLDNVDYEDGHLVTHSLPFVGLALSSLSTIYETATLVNGVLPPGRKGRLPDVPNPSGDLLQISVVIINLSVSRKVRVQGTVGFCTLNEEGTECDPDKFGTVSGAIVALRDIHQGFSQRRGGLDAGAVFALSGDKGKYALLVDNSALLDVIGTLKDPAGDLIVTATHPRYFGERPFAHVVTSAVHPHALADLYFIRAWRTVENTIPPFVSASHSPPLPTAEAEATLAVLAIQGASLPVIEKPTVVGIQSLVPGITVNENSVFISGAISEEQVGANGTRSRFGVRATETNALRVVLEIKASADGTQARTINYAMVFGGSEGGVTNPLPVVDLNDESGPTVVKTVPMEGGIGLSPGEPITIRFNEPIQKDVMEDTSAIQLSPGAGKPQVVLSDDQTELYITYYGLRPGTDYSLTLSQAIQDLSDNPLDGDPATPSSESFSLSFRTSEQRDVSLPGLELGGGAVARGIYAYTLDRIANRLKVFDLSDPGSPTLVSDTTYAGEFPRDLAMIPNYSFKTRPDAPVETRDLLAIVGGTTGALFDENANIQFAGQYLRVYDISDPVAPRLLSARIVTRSPAAIVTKVIWSPPLIGYLEIDFDFQQIGLVSLQAFIIGTHLSQAEYADLPQAGSEGEDLNGDGDYVDEGEELPLPSKSPAEFAGKVGALVLSDTNQRVQDATISSAAGHISVVLNEGKLLDGTGRPTSTVLPPAYRTIFAQGSPLPDEDRVAASFEFPGMRPKRVSAMFGVSVVVSNEIKVVDLAFVSLAPGTVDSNMVAVLDITNPLGPTLLTSIVVPSHHGTVQSVIERKDGLLALATTQDVLLVDPEQLAEATAAGNPHPALIGVIYGAGSGARTFASDLAGLNVVNLGGKNRLVQSAPTLQFVSILPTSGIVIDPQTLVDDPAARDAVLDVTRAVAGLFPARYRAVSSDDGTVVESSLSPPKPEVHYHVMVQAPGSAGDTIKLGLQSLNESGYPLRNKGKGFPPVQALDPNTLTKIGQMPRVECDATIGPLTAYRLSSDKRDPFYNVYLSKPFALTYEAYSDAELTALKSELDREILWSGHGIRAFIDPDLQENPAIGLFAAVADGMEKVVRPGASVEADSLAADYLLGPNPPHHRGFLELPGSLGTVAAHNSEVRTESTDIQLPGRRMPIVLTRHLGGQDLFDGPFGRGWDFEYNQRMLELHGGVFPPGANYPLVIRGGDGDEIAGSKDVLFHTGTGQTVQFEYTGEQAPPELASDPLLEELDWLTKASGFYLPATRGVFDALVRFESGQLARLTPEGTQYWYDRNGRLDRIYDRFEKNEIRIKRNLRGEITRVEDKAVDSERYLEFGYYRSDEDPLFNPSLDDKAVNLYVIGKIALVRDYSGREIEYLYDDCGRLVSRRGPKITQNGPQGYRGDLEVTYIYEDKTAANGLKGIISGDNVGSALMMSNQDVSDPNSPLVTDGNGATGQFSVSPSHENTAKAIAQGGGSTQVTLAAGTSASISIDKRALPESFTMNSGGDSATQRFEYHESGLLKKITYPRGNWVELVYDFNNPNVRARGNLLRVIRNPGSLGGQTLEMVYPRQDLKYNLTVGSGTDFNGSSLNFQLDASGREVGSITFGSAGSYEYTFNDYGQLETVTDPHGFVTTDSYDPQTGFLVSEGQGSLISGYEYNGIDGSRGYATRITAPSGSPQAPRGDLKYTERGRLIHARQDQLVEEMSWDRNGNLIRYSRSLGAGSDLIETRDYEQNGFLRQIKYLGVETDGTRQDLSYRFTPDELWRTKLITDPDDSVHEFLDFNVHGQPRMMKFGSYEESYTYDANGNLETQVGVGGGTTRHSYDGHDRLVSTETPVGESWAYVYQGSGAVGTLVITDKDGLVNQNTTWDRDELDRVKLMTQVGEKATRTEAWSYPSQQAVRTVSEGDTVTWTFTDSALLDSQADSIRQVNYGYQGDVMSSITSVEDQLTLGRIFGPLNSLGHSEGVSDLFGPIATHQVRHDGETTRTTDALGRNTLMPRSRFGEALEWKRPLGIDISYQFDENRQPSSIKDRADKGRDYEYNDFQKLETTTYRDGNSRTVTYQDGASDSATIPGGSVQFGTDKQGRTISRIVNFEGDQRVETYDYDALDRIKQATYPAGSTTHTFDSLGPMGGVQYNIGGNVYGVDYQLRGDGNVTSIRYPSGVDVGNGLDPAARIKSVTPGEGAAVISTRAFATATLPASEMLGDGLILRSNDYDARGRPVKITYRCQVNDELLAEVRYAYTDVNMVEARQLVHRSGRTRFLNLDEADRIKTDHVDARPGFGFEQANRPVPALNNTAASGFRSGFYRRDYQYDAGGLDYLNNVTSVNPDGLSIPEMDETPQPPDSLPRDSMGNQKLAEVWLPDGALPALGEVAALTLKYDGRGNLVRVNRSDLTQIEYQYDERDLMVQRIISGPSFAVPITRRFVYDENRLIEEYVDDGTINNKLQARYYYAEDEIPVAGDIRLADDQLHRHYFLTDMLGSVMGLADENGGVVERYHYSTHGVPEIEQRDLLAPRVSRIVSGEGGSLLVEFSERVLPPLIFSGGTGLLNSMQDINNSVLLEYDDNGTPTTDEGAKLYEENLPGMRFGAVIRFLPQFPIPAVLTVQVEGGHVEDEWGNSNPKQSIVINYNATPGTVLFVDDNVVETGPTRTASSIIGSPFLFQGQYYDYDTGLYYFRARHYNPYSGLFLQRDPVAYGDSPNLYAGFGNNPDSYRDPTGTLRIPGFRLSLGKILVGVGKRLTRLAPKALRPLGKQIRRSGEFVTTGMRASTRLRLKRFEKSFFADSRFSRYWDAKAVRAKMDFPENDPRIFQAWRREKDWIVLSTKDGFQFNAKLHRDGRVGIDVMLKHPDGTRAVRADVLGGGRQNYRRMFAEFGDDIKGWKGLLVEDNFNAITKALPKNFTQQQLKDAILNHSVTGQFWKQWARAKNLKPVVRTATKDSIGIDFEVDFIPIIPK